MISNYGIDSNTMYLKDCCFDLQAFRHFEIDLHCRNVTIKLRQLRLVEVQVRRRNTSLDSRPNALYSLNRLILRIYD